MTGAYVQSLCCTVRPIDTTTAYSLQAYSRQPTGYKPTAAYSLRNNNWSLQQCDWILPPVPFCYLMAAPPQAIWCDWIPLQSPFVFNHRQPATAYNCDRRLQPVHTTSRLVDRYDTTVAHNRPSPTTGYCLQQWAAVAYDDNNNRPSPMTGYCVPPQPGPMV